MDRGQRRKAVLLLLQEQPRTIVEIFGALGISQHHAHCLTRELSKAGKIHIGGWRNGGTKWRIREWHFGPGRDIPCPRIYEKKPVTTTLQLVERLLEKSQDALSTREIAERIGRSLEAVKDVVKFLREANFIHQAGTYRAGAHKRVKGALYSAGACPF